MTQSTSAQNPDTLEVAQGVEREELEGWVPELATQDEIFAALEKAFDYRGDVTVTLKGGERIEGYVFNRVTGGSLAGSYVQLYPVNANEKRRVAYSEIARLEFSGRDRAAGKHWENWVKQYREKKAAGERGFGLHPEALD